MLFCFQDFNSATGTCEGNLLGAVNSPEDCCFQPDRPVRPGLGGEGFVAVGSADCVSCMTIVGKYMYNTLLQLHC